ncbi:MAG: hypothetical protein ACR2JJ_02355 [Sphingomicrobium sp.]
MLKKILLPLVLASSACDAGPEQPADEGSDPLVATEANAVDTDAAEPAASESTGPVISVWSDSNARYTDEGSGELSNGNLWLTTRRDGPSGVSFAKREINCASGTYRYLQEGDSLESMSDNADAQMSALTEGSISTLVSYYVCRKHGRGSVAGV